MPVSMWTMANLKYTIFCVIIFHLLIVDVDSKVNKTKKQRLFGPIPKEKVMDHLEKLGKAKVEKALGKKSSKPFEDAYESICSAKYDEDIYEECPNAVSYWIGECKQKHDQGKWTMFADECWDRTSKFPKMLKYWPKKD